MTTTMSFNGTNISGVVLTPIKYGAREVRVQKSAVFGLNGVTTITGGLKPAELRPVVWITGFADSAAVNTYVTDTLAPLKGQAGTLSFAGEIVESYANTQLMVLQRIAHNGQAGQLPNNSFDVSNPWTDHIQFVFEQLR